MNDQVRSRLEDTAARRDEAFALQPAGWTTFPCGCFVQLTSRPSRFGAHDVHGFHLNRCRAHFKATPGAPDADGLARFTTACPWCHGPSEHAIELEFVSVVIDSICEACLVKHEMARERVA